MVNAQYLVATAALVLIHFISPSSVQLSTFGYNCLPSQVNYLW